ncbi:MAG: hypothetical protein HQK96_11960 [Nitrospirae bacterium]|nr:hypothetical protein [Nitrospirota bacterium]
MESSNNFVTGKIEYYSPEQLMRADIETVPRSEADFAARREGMSKYGFGDPLPIYKTEEGVLIPLADHDKVEIAIELGLLEIPCIKEDVKSEYDLNAFGLKWDKTRLRYNTAQKAYSAILDEKKERMNRENGSAVAGLKNLMAYKKKVAKSVGVPAGDETSNAISDEASFFSTNLALPKTHPADKKQNKALEPYAKDWGVSYHTVRHAKRIYERDKKRLIEATIKDIPIDRIYNEMFPKNETDDKTVEDPIKAITRDEKTLIKTFAALQNNIQVIADKIEGEMKSKIDEDFTKLKKNGNSLIESVHKAFEIYKDKESPKGAGNESTKKPAKEVAKKEPKKLNKKERKKLTKETHKELPGKAA